MKMVKYAYGDNENYASFTDIYRKLSNPPMLWSKYSSGSQCPGTD